MILGLLIVTSPALGADSDSLALMPTWGVLVWGCSFFVGGAMSAVGLLTTRGKWEAAGMTLLSADFGALVVAQLATDPRVLAVLFLLSLAGGTFHRALSLVWVAK